MITAFTFLLGLATFWQTITRPRAGARAILRVCIMRKLKTLFYLSLILCALALGGGIAALLAWGLSPPAWLAGGVAALLMGAALVYGFTAYLPNAAEWLWVRPIRGAVLITLGMAAMYVPPGLIVAAYLTGVGVRLVWQSAVDLAREGPPPGSPPPAPGHALARAAGGALQRREERPRGMARRHGTAGTLTRLPEEISHEQIAASE